MNPLVAQLLQSLAGPLEQFAVAAATGAGGPLAGAAVEAGEAVLNQAIGSSLVPKAATAGVAPVVVAAPAATPVVAQATVGVTATVPGIQPPVADPNAHPLLVEAGRAPLVPSAHPSGTVPAEADMNFPDIYDRLAAVEAKLNALVNATGMAGSAAMAAHP